MPDHEEPVEGEAVEVDENDTDQPGTDVVRRAAPTPALFREDQLNPEAQIAVATKYANVLKDVLDKQKMTSNISGKDHVDIEGWQTLGTIARVAVKIVDSGPVVDGTGAVLLRPFHVTVKHYKGPKGNRVHDHTVEYECDGASYFARAEARLPDGTLVGSSDAICSRTEEKWHRSDDTALLGMAQTRASSRAYRSALGWVVHLAGYATTPSSEMPAEGNGGEPAELPKFAQPFEGDTAKLQKAISYLVEQPNDEDGAADQRAVDLVEWVLKDCAGTMPAAAARALISAASMTKAAADEAATDPDNATD